MFGRCRAAVTEQREAFHMQVALTRSLPELGVTRTGENGQVTVKDSGEGIAADFLPHVFERFRQAEDAKARGLGLGLAIVKHLVEEHGGSVAASSEGRGLGALADRGQRPAAAGAVCAPARRVTKPDKALRRRASARLTCRRVRCSSC